MSRVPLMKVRTRFAPSPTGYLHIGGARTALFSWLYARKMGGTFILRIEDTDLERSTEESVQAIFQGMAWLNLDHDEGPFYQTHRFDRYKAVIAQLVQQGHAYYCTCSRDRLEKLREQQMADKQKPRYDGCCRNKNLPATADAVVRFKTPLDGEIVIDDAVKGRVVISNGELDDLIIARSDGVPTYNLTVVVDDMDMEITHVIRGDDHLNNTPRQIHILKALGATLPVYAHVPMILGADGSRLSKRHGAVSVMQYYEDGYLPEALLNYLVRLGWSSGDQEIFTREEMIELFDISAINKSASTFNPEKLKWLNQHYIKTLDVTDIAERLPYYLQKIGVSTTTGGDLIKVLEIYQERCSTMVELAQDIAFIYQDFTEYDAKLAEKQFKPEARPVLESVGKALADVTDWRAAALHHAITHVVETLGVGFGKVGQPVRLALTGHGRAPGIDVTLELLGKEKSLARIAQAVAYIK
jgi:glutamyl-tRNA synthetase